MTTKSTSDDDEVEALKREVSALKKRPARRRKTAGAAAASDAGDAGKATGSTGAQPGGGHTAASKEAAEKAREAETEDTLVHEVAEHLEGLAKELEEVAAERPALALTVAFALGVAVGQMLGRR